MPPINSHSYVKVLQTLSVGSCHLKGPLKKGCVIRGIVIGETKVGRIVKVASLSLSQKTLLAVKNEGAVPT